MKTFLLFLLTILIKTAFQGPWAKTMLAEYGKLVILPASILYTGSVNQFDELLKDKEVDNLSLFVVSSEYGIEVLVALTVKNFKIVSSQSRRVT